MGYEFCANRYHIILSKEFGEQYKMVKFTILRGRRFGEFLRHPSFLGDVTKELTDKYQTSNSYCWLVYYIIKGDACLIIWK